MRSEPHSISDTDIGDFAEILLPESGNELPVIIGGHAVGLWARYFLSKGIAALAEFLPFRSKDLDLVGTVDCCRHCTGVSKECCYIPNREVRCSVGWRYPGQMEAS